jgi:hypothetical protein
VITSPTVRLARNDRDDMKSDSRIARFVEFPLKPVTVASDQLIIAIDNHLRRVDDVEIESSPVFVLTLRVYIV